MDKDEATLHIHDYGSSASISCKGVYNVKQILWHGTSLASAESILKNGWSEDVAMRHRRPDYSCDIDGKGFNFYNNSLDASGFAIGEAWGKKKDVGAVSQVAVLESCIDFGVAREGKQKGVYVVPYGNGDRITTYKIHKLDVTKLK